VIGLLHYQLTVNFDFLNSGFFMRCYVKSVTASENQLWIDVLFSYRFSYFQKYMTRE